MSRNKIKSVNGTNEFKKFVPLTQSDLAKLKKLNEDSCFGDFDHSDKECSNCKVRNLCIEYRGRMEDFELRKKHYLDNANFYDLNENLEDYKKMFISNLESGKSLSYDKLFSWVKSKSNCIDDKAVRYYIERLLGEDLKSENGEIVFK